MAANSRLAAFTPVMYTDYVQMYFKKKLVAASHFTDFSDDVTGGGESIYIPAIAALGTPSSVTQTTGALTDRYVADTRTLLTLNTWKAFSLRFTDFVAAQLGRNYNAQKKYAEAIADNLATTFDAAILTEARDSLQLNVSSSTTTINATYCRDAIAIMDSYSVPRAGLLWIFKPSSYWQLMRSTPIYDASVFGGGNAPMATGTHGSLFGVPIVVTANAPTWGSTAKTNFLVHREAVSYALANLGGNQSGPRIQTIKGDGLYTRLVGDIAYGVKILDAYAGVKIKSAN